MSRDQLCAQEQVLCVQNAVLCVQGAVLCVQGAVLCVRGGSPGEIGEFRSANKPPSQGQQGGEGEGSPPLGGRRSEAQGVVGEAQRHRARRLHAMRPEASADLREIVFKFPSAWPRGARNGSPNLRPAGGGATRRSRRSNVTFSRVLCGPRFAVRVWATFFGKEALSVERCFLFFLLQHLSNGSAYFGQEAVPIRVPAMVFQPDAFQPRGVAKIGPKRFSRIL